MMFGDGMLTYGEYLLGQGRSVKTVADYQREIDFALEWFQARGWDLAAALPSQLKEYQETRPNTPSVRAHLRSALVYWWDFVGVHGWPKAIDVPTPPPMECKAFSPKDAKRINRAAQGWWREGTAVLVGIHLGCRNEETCSMRWEWFDRELKWCTITGKGNKQRTVKVAKDLRRELEPYRQATGFVFEGRNGGPLSHGTLRLWLRKVADEAGVDERTFPHRLRHTFGATANDETRDLRAVQYAMGHARPETTSGYTRATAKRLKKVSKAVAKAVR